MCSPYAPASCGIPDARGISKKQNEKAKSCLQRFAAAVGSRSFSHARWDLRTYEPIKKREDESHRFRRRGGQISFSPFCLLANFGKQSDTLDVKTVNWRIKSASSHRKRTEKDTKKKNPFVSHIMVPKYSHGLHSLELFASLRAKKFGLKWQLLMCPRSPVQRFPLSWLEPELGSKCQESITGNGFIFPFQGPSILLKLKAAVLCSASSLLWHFFPWIPKRREKCATIQLFQELPSWKHSDGATDIFGIKLIFVLYDCEVDYVSVEKLWTRVWWIFRKP